jgi:DNA-binding SARP family transcriptional activator
VSLGEDGWLDLGLAVAITAAATLVWKLRRRRYTPRPPDPRLLLDAPDLAAMPGVVTRVRRGLRAPDPHEATSIDDPLTPAAEDAGGDDADIDQPDADATPPLNLPALGNPMLAAWPPAGLGLTGPGAEAAARGFLASALAAGGVDDPHARSQLVLPATTLATLLGATAVNVPDTPRLTVTGDLTEALETLEEQTMHRTRLLYGHEVDTITQLRDTDPYEEALPPILLLADAAVPHERARIAALLSQGQRLDIHGVLLGAWPDGDTVVVAVNGATTPADGEGSRHGSHPADVARLAVLTAAETAVLLATLAESHTGLPQPPAPAEPTSRAHPTAAQAPAATAARTASQADGDSGGDAPASKEALSCEAASGVAPTGHAAVSHAPAGADRETPAMPTAATAAADVETDLDNDTDDGDAATAADVPGLVAVQVLGRPTILGADPGESLRAKALELLVYLIARGGAATTDAIVEDLVPDATVSKAPHRIHTYVYALRKALRRTGGRATYITHPPHRYQLNPDAFDVDLWRMRDALADAQAATTDQARVAALRHAIATYTGPFAARARYEWAEPYREAVRQQALNAHLALAEALTDQPDEALAVLDAAISHDPYAEPLYQHAMRRHADLGHAEAIAARLAELTHRLEEIDAEPVDETADLAAALTADLRRRAHRGPRREGGAA